MLLAFELVPWSPGRLAVTGSFPEPRRLLAALVECKAKVEHWRGENFTFSFPEAFSGRLIRIVGELEAA